MTCDLWHAFRTSRKKHPWNDLVHVFCQRLSCWDKRFPIFLSFLSLKTPSVLKHVITMQISQGKFFLSFTKNAYILTFSSLIFGMMGSWKKWMSSLLLLIIQWIENVNKKVWCHNTHSVYQLVSIFSCEKRKRWKQKTKVSGFRLRFVNLCGKGKPN